MGTRAAFAAIVALLLGWATPAPAQPERGANPHRELYLYQGADREPRLIAGARKERQLTLYTSLNLKDSVPLTEAFEKKYGVKVSLWRAGSEKVVQRAVAESRAGRFAFDVLETNGPEMEAMHREKLLEEFFSPHFKDLPPAAFPKHRHYVADRFNFFTIVYNTKLVKPEDVPNSYQDLLHPRFAGRIGIEAGDVDWFGAMVKHMGEAKGLAYFRKLSETMPQIRSGHTLMAELSPPARSRSRPRPTTTMPSASPSRGRRSSGRRSTRRSHGPTRSAWRARRRIRTPRCCSPTSCCRMKDS
jgi:iron(III) transport system substrate-binding protein